MSVIPPSLPEDGPLPPLQQLNVPSLGLSSSAPLLGVGGGSRASTSHGHNSRKRPPYILNSTCSTPAGSRLWTARSNASSTFPPLDSWSRVGSGRFNGVELSCFKRLPQPTPYFQMKAEERGLHGLSLSPAGRSDGFLFKGAASPADTMRSVASCATSECEDPDEPKSPTAALSKEKATPLPQEDTTTKVLDQIFPRGGLGTKTQSDSAMAKSRGVSWRGNEEGAKRPELSRKSTFRSSLKEGFRRTLSGDALSLANSNAKKEAIVKMQRYRNIMLEKFQTIKGAFEVVATSGGFERELSRKQFGIFLNKHLQGLTKEDHMQIFEFLDANKDGHISMLEFHTAIEAAGPVRSVEDFRRRALALGYPSMMQVATRMFWADSGTPSKKLGLKEFGDLLCRVGVEEEEEHKAIFDCIAIKDDLTGAKQPMVTLEQMLAAFATVAPPLVLEELREKIFAKFQTAEDAFDIINPGGIKEALKRTDFALYLEQHLGFSPHNAHKAFTLMDCNESKFITVAEFTKALQLTEPSLFLEDIRRKVRQRFRSIDEAFKSFAAENAVKPMSRSVSAADDHARSHAAAAAHAALGSTKKSLSKSGRIDTPSKKKRTRVLDVLGSLNGTSTPDGNLEDFTEILKQVQFSETDAKLLLHLMDVNGDGQLEPHEIRNGLLFFAPSVILEDLRLFLLNNNKTVTEPFLGLSAEKRDRILDLEAFESILKGVGVPEGINVAEVFGLVECRNRGGVSINELLSALQSAGAGGLVPLSSDQADARARQQVRYQMAPFKKCAGELRTELRVSAKHVKDAQPVGKKSKNAPQIYEPENERVPETVLYPAVRASYKKVKCKVDDGKLEDKGKVQEGLTGYYTSASQRMIHDMPLLGQSHHRAEEHRIATRHRAFLGSDAPPLTAT
eukprot:TRINITY_DN91499_c0_g1_i1.p1 TRINITY_DN91499_c0_g1~~TRINITY_DN91499_c0_g1_i1.p1  ORF type:complete len:951 (-),score=225.89 TRINITY_DN91499_c0_g1_i1:56-2764(-)